VQLNVNVAGWFTVTEAVPEIVCEPFQPPEAVHEVAPVDDQVRFVDEPAVTVAAAAEIDTMGGAADCGAG
jgi:hypothetical protein